MVSAAQSETAWERLAREARVELGDVRPCHWPCEFPDVFLEAQGFDAVVGNPPYVRQELLSPLKPLLKKSFDAFDGSADLYVYFDQLGLRLLRPGGRLSLIVTNKWMRAAYGEPLRAVLSQCSWLDSIVDFGHARQLFKGVDVFPCIVVATKPTSTRQAPEVTRICVIEKGQIRLEDLYEQIDSEGFDVPRAVFATEAWLLEPAAVRRLMAKLRASGTTLGEYVGRPPLRGLLTGLNEAFIVTGKRHAEIVSRDENARDLFRPLIRGRDVSRWSIEWRDQWLLTLKSSEN